MRGSEGRTSKLARGDGWMRRMYYNRKQNWKKLSVQAGEDLDFRNLHLAQGSETTGLTI